MNLNCSSKWKPFSNANMSNKHSAKMFHASTDSDWKYSENASHAKINYSLFAPYPLWWCNQQLQLSSDINIVNIKYLNIKYAAEHQIIWNCRTILVNIDRHAIENIRIFCFWFSNKMVRNVNNLCMFLVYPIMKFSNFNIELQRKMARFHDAKMLHLQIECNIL